MSRLSNLSKEIQMNAIAKIWISPNHSFLVKSNYRNMNNAFNFEFVQLEAILCYVWCVCPAQFYLHIFASFIVLHSFSRLFGSISTKDYKVASLRASLLLNLFEHSFICSLAREYQRTHTHTYDIHIIYGILKYSVTKAYILTASNELHKIKFNQ